MATTARFLADFSDFNTAVQGATLNLRKMEEGAAGVDTRLSRAFDQFSGRKFVADAAIMVEAVERLGGASKLTEAEFRKLTTTSAEAAEKLRAMGEKVPDNMQKYADQVQRADGGMEGMIGTAKSLAGALGLAFSIDTVVGWGRAILQTASDLVALADSTGMTTEQVQQLNYIASQSGTTMEALTQASADLQANLSSDAVAASLQKIGLSVRQIREADPYEALGLISDGLRNTQLSVEETERVMRDLFGGKARRILAALSGDFRQMGKDAGAAADSSVRAVAAASDAIDRMKAKVSSATIQIVGNIAMVAEQHGWIAAVAGSAIRNLGGPYQQWVKDAQELYDAQHRTNNVVRTAADLTADYDAKIKRLTTSYGSLSDADKKRIAAGKDAHLNAQEIAADLNLNVQAVQKYFDVLTEQETAQHKVAEASREQKEALAELDAAGDTWIDTINQMNPELFDLIKQQLEAGRSADVVAKALGRSKTEIRAVTEAIKDQKETLKELAAAEKARGELNREWNAEVLKQTATTTDAAIAEILRWSDAEVAKLDKTKAGYQETYDLIQQITKEKLAAVMVNWDEVRAAQVSTLEDTKNRAQATYDFLINGDQRYTDEAKANAKKRLDAATEALELQKARNKAFYAEIDAMMAAAYEQGAKRQFMEAETAAQHMARTSESVEERWKRIGWATDDATAKTRTYSATLQSVTSQQYEALAKMNELSAAANRQAGGGGAFWSAADVAKGQEEAARKYREQAAIAAQREAYMAPTSQPWGTASNTTINVQATNMVHGNEIAGALTSSLKQQGIRLA